MAIAQIEEIRNEESTSDSVERRKEEQLEQETEQTITQLCDLEVEELAKRDRAVLEEPDINTTDSGKRMSSDFKGVVAELIRRAASPDPGTANLRAVNSYLRTKVDRLEKEIQDLKIGINIRNRDSDRVASESAQDDAIQSPPRKKVGRMKDRIGSIPENQEPTMDWSNLEDKSEDSQLRSPVDPQVLDVITKKVVTAVDTMLMIFLERLIPLEKTGFRETDNLDGA